MGDTDGGRDGSSKCSARSTSVGQSNTARAVREESSRTLPGQGYRFRASSVAASTTGPAP